ncbi:bifunctional trypsin-like peptidase domain-containing/SEL1-like repeat protein [Pyxidicoccus xibeiensis]|uniref:bifunctional trypsin-like peptidase domain-containing/SEL1-like repeat protein n=1 Tax=Pyxidicoccus xibeiensis TaxID=2906759 RepID=UPI0020A82D6E|nr:trypsin-like peptidase domain-containing protein [Pyxidicoccus xibeiensis]MCP3137286.1 trypsin-like peptidase domain-containing protein [Pyxidicoccus xibeiensis]
MERWILCPHCSHLHERQPAPRCPKCQRATYGAESFELDPASAEPRTAEVALSHPEPAPAPRPVVDDSWDFSGDLVVEPIEPAGSTAPAVPVEEDFSLEFELDLPAPSHAEVSASRPAPRAEEAPPPHIDIIPPMPAPRVLRAPSASTPAWKHAQAPRRSGKLRRLWEACVPRRPTAGSRLAGGFLLAGVALTVAGHVLTSGAQVSGKVVLAAAAIDTVLGLGLLLGVARVHAVVLARLLLGLGLLAVASRAADPVVVALQLGTLVGLGLLLAGEPGPWRRLAGSVLTGGVCTILAVLLSARFTQTSPLNTRLLSLRGALEPDVVLAAQGQDVPYRLTFPATGWRQASASYLASLDSGLDRVWLLPSRDAVVAVRVLHLPGAGGVDLDEAAGKLLEARGQQEDGTSGFEVVATEPVEGRFDAARRYHLRLQAAGQPMEAHAAVLVHGDYAFFVDAVAPRHRFPSLDGELAAIVASFAFEPPPPPRLHEETLEHVRRASVLVHTYDATGSGFVFQSDHGRTLILTNDHVVRGRTGVPSHVGVVMTMPDGKRQNLRAAVRASDQARDLAVLALLDQPERWPELTLRHTTSLPEPMALFVVGYPFGQGLGFQKNYPDVTVNGGWLGLQTPEPVREQGRRVVEVGINPGNSGGPVVDASGRAIGVAVAHLRGSETSVMITSETVDAWLQLQREPPATFDDRELAVKLAPPAKAMEGEEQARTATVLVRSERGTAAGVVIERREAGRLVVLASGNVLGADWKPGAPLPALTVRLRPAQPESLELKAEVLRASADAGLVLLSVVSARDDVVPLTLAQGETLSSGTPVRVLGYRLDAKGQLRRNPVPQLASGAVASAQRDSAGKVRFLQVDVGINHGQTSGPVLDAQGALVGLAVERLKDTNISLVLPGEHLMRFLRGGIVAGAWKLLHDRDGRCALSALAVLENPLGMQQTVRLRLGLEARLVITTTNPYEYRVGSVLAEVEAGTRREVELGAEVDCPRYLPILQLELVDAQGIQATHPKQGRLNGVGPGTAMGFTGGTEYAEHQDADMVEFFLTPALPPERWSQTCAPYDAKRCEQQCQEGQAVSCLRLGRHHMDSLREAEALSAFAHGCKLGSVEGCIELGLSSQWTGRSLPNDGLVPSAGLLKSMCETLPGILDYRRACWALRPEQYALLLRSATHSCSTFRSSCVEQGQLHLAGPWSPRYSATRAARAFETSCAANEVSGCLELAHLQLEGLGVPQNVQAARATYEKYCHPAPPGQRGEYQGCEPLARLHATGNGVPRNLQEARRLMGMSCEGWGSVSPYCGYMREQTRVRALAARKQ